MKIRRIRIRLSYLWYNITLSVASLLLSMTSHAQNRPDSVIVTLPSQTPLTNSNALDISEFDGLGVTTVDKAKQAYGPAAKLDIVLPGSDDHSSTSISKMTEEKPYPLVAVDGIIQNLADMDKFDWQNGYKNKRKVARLIGIPARKIKDITFLNDDAAVTIWGYRGKNGVLEVRTRTKD